MHEGRDDQLGELLPQNIILTAAEVAQALRVSVEAVRRWADQWHDSGGHEGLPGFKVGKQWRFYRKAVFDYVISQRQMD
ncbi:MAG TPA: helix-turn-helix domain-containing protein [Terracidiphilus sp.]|nr:helix-turn-helix domain-containing protein [Terracidiphilus sp.]